MRTPAPVQSVPLSEAQRLHRIAELLCKAIVLAEASRAVLPAGSLAEPAPTVAPIGFAGDNLVPEEIEIDPFGCRSSLRTTQHPAVKGARLVQVVNGKGQVETRSVCHGLKPGNG